jgi:hypothetical protein
VIGLDTNILVRYLAQDDPMQSRKATQIFEHRLTEANPGFLSLVTMVEAAWVLERAYSLFSPSETQVLDGSPSCCHPSLSLLLRENSEAWQGSRQRHGCGDHRRPG